MRKPHIETYMKMEKDKVKKRSVHSRRKIVGHRKVSASIIKIMGVAEIDMAISGLSLLGDKTKLLKKYDAMFATTTSKKKSSKETI